MNEGSQRESRDEMLDYTSTEVLLKTEATDRKREREELRAGGDDREQVGALPYFEIPVGDGGGLGEPDMAPLSWAGELPEGAGEAASGFLEAAGHLAGEILQVLGAILSALGEADWGD